MRAIYGVVWAIGAAAIAACGGGGDTTAPPAEASLTCVQSPEAGAAMTCSVTLPERAELTVTLTSVNCNAHADRFAITAPVESVLTADACFETAGKVVDLGGAYPPGTPVTMTFTPGAETGISPGIAAAQVEGSYPHWTIHLEDAVAAYSNEADDYNDLAVTVTANPVPGQ